MRALTIPSERRLDPRVVAVLSDIDAATRSSDITYFIGGALARDIVLFHAFGQPSGRATRDVDMMLCVDSWPTYSAFRTSLLARGSYSEDPSVKHRLWHGERKPAGVPLDILPFGDVEGPEGAVAWPPDGAILMKVTGFAEAASTALDVEVGDGTHVPVASLPALAVMKLSAWLDRHAETGKDAADLRAMLKGYHAAGNDDRLYGPESDLLRDAGFDPELAGARLLARDAVRVSPDAVGILLPRFAGPLQEALGRQVVVPAVSLGDDPVEQREGELFRAFWTELQKAEQQRHA